MIRGCGGSNQPLQEESDLVKWTGTVCASGVLFVCLCKLVCLFRNKRVQFGYRGTFAKEKSSDGGDRKTNKIRGEAELSLVGRRREEVCVSESN